MTLSELYKANSAWQTNTILSLRAKNGLIEDKAKQLLESHGYKQVDAFWDNDIWLEEHYDNERCEHCDSD